MRLFCFIGLHSWKRLPDELGGCGMGLEWFEQWECRRCLSKFDRVRGGYMPLKYSDLRARPATTPDPCPHCGEDQNKPWSRTGKAGKHDGYCGVC